MKYWALYLPYFLFLIVAGGCASVETRLPIPNSNDLVREAAQQETGAFARYLKLYKRLDKVSAPILASNAELCKKTRLDFGITTHSKKSYPKKLRGGAARRLAARPAPSVLFTRKGSPASANVQTGDVIIGSNDQAISAHHKQLKDAGKLHIRRDDQDIYLDLNGTPVCDYDLVLKMSGTVNAYANGKSITVTTAMIDFTTSDDELALVIGHELAHNTMKHVRKAVWNTVISGFAARTTRPFESEADYVGLYYAARAGYNLDGVETFWRRLGVRHPKSIVHAKTHPVTPKRLLAIQMTAKEIAAKRADGLELVPNYLPGK